MGLLQMWDGIARIPPQVKMGMLLVGAIIYLFWAMIICVYRLYFHPMAKFPGPKLAAITGWVETYYDVFRGGQFIFKIEEWHKKYGPVVRIAPWEVSIADPDFVDIMFAGNSKFDKKIEWKYRFGAPHSTVDTIEHQHHRLRRAALAPFFSKQRIGGITEFISSRAHRLCDRLENEYRQSEMPAVLNDCFAAFTFDIITYYSFSRCFDYLEYPDFKAPFLNAAVEIASTVHTMGQFPWILSTLQSLPQWLSVLLNPPMRAIFAFHEEIGNEIRSIKARLSRGKEDMEQKSVFKEILTSDLAEEEKEIGRLKDEGTAVVAAGVETTATALTKALFFITNDPAVKSKLRAELETVFPDVRHTPPLATLEALPYLSAVVNETLRMSGGVSQRTVRKSRGTPVVWKDKVIPADYYFSMTSYLTHRDPSIWDSPEEFLPERWLAGKGKNGQPLSKYLMTFGKGPRMCLGLNLAYAELYIGLAVVLRRCNFELYNTTRADVDMKADFLIPRTDPQSQGVRVLVK